MSSDEIGWAEAQTAAPAGGGGLDDKLGLWLRMAQRVFADEVNRDFHRDRVTQLDFFILSIIAGQPDCRQSTIAMVLDLKSPNLAVAIDYLVQRAWVEKAADPVDRRANRLRLTPTGSVFVAELATRYTQITGRYFTGPQGLRDNNAAIQMLKHLSIHPGRAGSRAIRPDGARWAEAGAEAGAEAQGE